jgi:alcohol dehydrogenase class IV
MNAIAHAGKCQSGHRRKAILIISPAVESLYSKETNPLTQHYAAEGIRSLSHALLEIKQDPESLSARASAQYGAWLCAMCLGSTKMGLHHKMCHAVGGALSLSHAETHTVVLPRALAYNAPAVPTALRIIGEALPFGDGDAVRGLHMLVEELGLPNGLHQIGMKESDVSVIVEQMMASGFENPVPLELEKVERLTRACFEGARYHVSDHAGNHRL